MDDRLKILINSAKILFGDDAQMIHGKFMVGNHIDKAGKEASFIVGLGSGEKLSNTDYHEGIYATVIVIPHGFRKRLESSEQSPEEFLARMPI
jgi:hypothetical protein